jgi:crotonobetainyl-CoA:carnitine CoA-transferase CaiB-like acyl-CoA transferase
MPRPLDGLRVLELGTFVSAPFTGKLFAGYGADVVKVEAPGGDPSRAHGPFRGGVRDPETSALFLYLNTAKRSVVLDLATAAGLDAFLRLAATADVVIENFRPSEMRALGVTYDRLRSVNPRVTLVSITAFGQSGPYADFRANNLTTFAMGGQMFITGTPEGGPLKNGGYQADYQGGLNAFSAATMGVLAADRDGEGQHIDVSVQQCMAPILEAGIPYYSYMGRWSPIRRGNFMATTIGIYPCLDGYVGVHVMPRNWEPFCRALGREDFLSDPRFRTGADRLLHGDELMAELFTTLAGETREEWFRRAGQFRAPIAYVHTMADMIASPHLNVRGNLTHIDHPAAGDGVYFGPPWWMGDDGWRHGRAPLLGEHTDQVLREAGLTAAEIARVRS